MFWKFLPEPVREMLEAPYRRDARIEIQKILSKNPSKSLNILDAGAGDQFVKKFIKNQEGSYVAVDLEPISKDVVYGNVEQLDLEKDIFDLVFCLEVLEYVPDPPKALEEFFRVLKKGGQLVLTTPLLVTGYHNDLHRWSLPKVRSLIEEAGFGTVEVKPMGGYFRMLGWHISKLSGKIRKPKKKLWWPFYYLLKIPFGLVFQIMIPLIFFSLDFLDKEKRDTCGYVAIATK